MLCIFLGLTLLPAQADEGVSPTAIREISLLKAFQHQNVVQLVAVHVDRKVCNTCVPSTDPQSRLCTHWHTGQEALLSLVFEYAEHDLFEMLRAQREHGRGTATAYGLHGYTIKSLLWQMLLATQALHAAAIMHRDLKPSNVLVMDNAGAHGRVKIADFGLAR